MNIYLQNIINAENERRVYLGKEPKYSIEGEKIFYTHNQCWTKKYCIYDGTKGYVSSIFETYQTTEDTIQSILDLRKIRDALIFDDENHQYEGKVIKTFKNFFLIKLNNNSIIGLSGRGLQYYRGARGFCNRGPKISASPEVGDNIICWSLSTNEKGIYASKWVYTDLDERIARGRGNQMLNW